MVLKKTIAPYLTFGSEQWKMKEKTKVEKIRNLIYRENYKNPHYEMG